MTEKEFNQEVDKGVYTLTAMAHFARNVRDNKVISAAGEAYIREEAGMVLRFCDALKGQNVKMD